MGKGRNIEQQKKSCLLLAPLPQVSGFLSCVWEKMALLIWSNQKNKFPACLLPPHPHQCMLAWDRHPPPASEGQWRADAASHHGAIESKWNKTGTCCRMCGNREKGALWGKTVPKLCGMKMDVPHCKHPSLGKLPAEPWRCTSAETLFSPALAEIHLHSHGHAPKNHSCSQQLP